jgi:hypothetical protein
MRLRQFAFGGAVALFATGKVPWVAMKFAMNSVLRQGWMTGIRRLTVIASVSCVLVSCAAVSSSNKTPFSLDDLNVDPLWCTAISLRNDVQIKKEIIHEPSIMSDRFLLVLRYREGGDETEFTPELKIGYNNISLVSEVNSGTDRPLIVYRRYCVIEMWRFYPEEKVKCCYLWTIGDEALDMKVMEETLGGEFLGERLITLDDSQTSKLKAFYEQLAKRLLDLLEESLPDA